MCVRAIRKSQGELEASIKYDVCFAESAGAKMHGAQVTICGAKSGNHDSKHFLIEFFRRKQFLGPELVTFLGPKFGFACSFMIPPWPFQQDDTNDSGPMQIPIHLLQHILRYATKLDTVYTCDICVRVLILYIYIYGHPPPPMNYLELFYMVKHRKNTLFSKTEFVWFFYVIYKSPFSKLSKNTGKTTISNICDIKMY